MIDSDLDTLLSTPRHEPLTGPEMAYGLAVFDRIQARLDAGLSSVDLTGARVWLQGDDLDRLKAAVRAVLADPHRLDLRRALAALVDG